MTIRDFSDLLSSGLAKHPRNTTRLDAFRTALAQVAGVPIEDVAVKTVSQVSADMDNRLGEWQARKPNLGVGALILDPERPEKVDQELEAAKRRAEDVMRSGRYRGGILLLFTQQGSKPKRWQLSAIVERGDLATSLVTDRIQSAYPTAKVVSLELPAPHDANLMRVSVERNSHPSQTWIEITKSGHEHGGQGWEFGRYLWSPSRDKADRDRYAIMRTPRPGDLVLHVLDTALVGYSYVESRAEEIRTEPPLPGPWAGMSPYYRIALTGFEKTDRAYAISDLLADHGDEIREDIRVNAPLRYPFYEVGSGTLRTVQGAYLTQCSPALYAVLQDELGLPEIAGSSQADIDGESPRYWAIAAGEGGRVWPEFKQESLIAIGWDALGDLRQFSSKEEIAGVLMRLRGDDTYPMNDSLACYQFCHTLRVGDHVFVKRGVSQILGHGKIRSDYMYDAGRAEYRNIRYVEWLAIGEWNLPEDCRIPQKSLTDVSEYDRLLAFVLPRMSGTTQALAVNRDITPPPAYTVDDALTELFIDRKEFVRILEALFRKRNLVLEGPPGVGKTFVAKRVAYALIGSKSDRNVQMVQFHQSYSYEDFVRGWRPNSQGGFSLRDGVFTVFCERARHDPEAKYVFIIDEINRGNLSKIFGELLMLIEADKRGPDYAVPLAYSKESEAEPAENGRFFVPANLYILGLMNTADRSLAMVDYALRRRFAFVRLGPAFANQKFRAFLRQRGVPDALFERIVSRLTHLNQEIKKDTKNLGPGFEIGHSYFCPQGDEENCGPEWYEAIVKGEIVPLLREYWFDDEEQVSAAMSQLLG